MKKNTKEVQKTILYLVLSLALIFHLCCILITPISGTYLADRFDFLVTPYSRFFEITSRWGFFSPEPGPPPVYIEYEALRSDGSSVAQGYFPARRGPHLKLSEKKMDPHFQVEAAKPREFFNRQMCVVRFVAGSPERMEKIMGPFFCKKFSEAASIKLWLTYEGVPSIDEIVKETRKMGESYVFERKWIGQALCLK